MNKDDLIQAFVNKNFATVLLETNKKLKIQALLSKKVIEEYLAGNKPIIQTRADNHGETEESILQYPIGFWIHSDSLNMCCAKIVGFVAPEDVEPKKDKIVLLGVVVGIIETKAELEDVKAFETTADKTIKAKERKERYNAYAHIPELNDLLQAYDLSEENF